MAIDTKVFGIGCSNCKRLYAKAEKAIHQAGIPATRTTVETSEEITAYRILATPSLIIPNPQAPEPRSQTAKAIGCSCGSGIPAKRINVNGKSVEMLALPLIFQQSRELGRSLDTAGERLYEMVKVYNNALPEDAENYREAVLREHAGFCEEPLQ